MLLANPLLQPEEASGAIVSDLNEVVQREKATRKRHFVEQLAGLLLADGIAMEDLGVCLVVGDLLGGHCCGHWFSFSVFYFQREEVI